MAVYTDWGFRELIVELERRDALQEGPLRRVLNHYLGEEQRHFDESDQPKDHIYLDLVAVCDGLLA